MDSILAMFYVFFIYSIGDFIADRTKAFISMFLVSATLFTISFWCGIPRTLFVDSGLLPFAKITICMAMIHIGSSIQFQDFLKEWRTVIVALGATFAICFGVYFLGRLFIDPYYALMSAPIMAGATISYLIMAPMADVLGRPDIQIFGVLILVTQSFIGIPLSSFFCKKEGDAYIERFRAGTLPKEERTEQKQAFRQLFHIPEKFSTPNLIICKLALISYFCAILGKLTGINWMIFGLLAGVFFHALGLVEENCLTKANGFTFVMASIFTMIFAGLTQTTPPDAAVHDPASFPYPGIGSCALHPVSSPDRTAGPFWLETFRRPGRRCLLRLPRHLPHFHGSGPCLREDGRRSEGGLGLYDAQTDHFRDRICIRGFRLDRQLHGEVGRVKTP